LRGAGAPTLLQHNAFEQSPAKLTLISTGYQLALVSRDERRRHVEQHQRANKHSGPAGQLREARRRLARIERRRSVSWCSRGSTSFFNRRSVCRTDLGVWPDPARVDGATKRHDGAGDFPAWIAERRAAPRPTVFIKGNHEDFVWLDAQPSSEVLPGLHYLRNGHVHELVAGDEVMRVGGVGGCFGPSNFERRSSTLQGYAMLRRAVHLSAVAAPADHENPHTPRATRLATRLPLVLHSPAADATFSCLARELRRGSAGRDHSSCSTRPRAQATTWALPVSVVVSRSERYRRRREPRQFATKSSGSRWPSTTAHPWPSPRADRDAPRARAVRRAAWHVRLAWA